MITTIEARVADVVALLSRVARDHAPVALASSFGAEDMVLIDLVARHALPIEILTLDTGRLPDETHLQIDRVREHYRLTINVLHPDAAALQAFVAVNGANPFYRSIELRLACCAIRKARPLARGLAGMRGWITGQRRAQSITRSDLAVEEFDAERGIPKFNPLADWSEADVWDYLRSNGVPWHPLHDRGYPSIGCAPCTRPIEPGEDLRAGRWWWERPEHRECGLHRRSLDVPVRVIGAGVPA
ncbi:MAG TPA: phosphoadenylyl-sulfate reductase [Casimicrobiaceae bacterium]|nr:phosphoadenylyl-sulfate reductase [Casimicrobiaceae bacterium]